MNTLVISLLHTNCPVRSLTAEDIMLAIESSASWDAVTETKDFTLFELMTNENRRQYIVQGVITGDGLLFDLTVTDHERATVNPTPTQTQAKQALGRITAAFAHKTVVLAMVCFGMLALHEDIWLTALLN